MRLASNNDERLEAALCSTTKDLHQDGNGRVVVSGVLPNGDRIYLGEVDELALYEKCVNPRNIIDHIRFGKLC